MIMRDCVVRIIFFESFRSGIIAQRSVSSRDVLAVCIEQHKRGFCVCVNN